MINKKLCGAGYCKRDRNDSARFIIVPPHLIRRSLMGSGRSLQTMRSQTSQRDTVQSNATLDGIRAEIMKECSAHIHAAFNNACKNSSCVDLDQINARSDPAHARWHPISSHNYAQKMLASSAAGNASIIARNNPLSRLEGFPRIHAARIISGNE